MTTETNHISWRYAGPFAIAMIAAGVIGWGGFMMGQDIALRTTATANHALIANLDLRVTKNELEMTFLKTQFSRMEGKLDQLAIALDAHNRRK